MILFYSNKKSKADDIKKLCAGLGQQTRELSGADLNRALGEIISGDGVQFGPSNFAGGMLTKKVEAPAFYSMPDLIIFSGLTDSELDAFLAAYKKAGIEETKLKAAVTPYNLLWTLYGLIGQLELESNRFK